MAQKQAYTVATHKRQPSDRRITEFFKQLFSKTQKARTELTHITMGARRPSK